MAYRINYIQAVGGPDRARLERVAAILRKITGNNWQVSSYSSHVMSGCNDPILKRFA